MGVIAQGLLQVLAILYPDTVWQCFGSWLRTIRPGMGGIGRFVPNPCLADLTDKLDRLRDEFRDATLDFVATIRSGTGRSAR